MPRDHFISTIVFTIVHLRLEASHFFYFYLAPLPLPIEVATEWSDLADLSDLSDLSETSETTDDALESPLLTVLASSSSPPSLAPPTASDLPLKRLTFSSVRGTGAAAAFALAMRCRSCDRSGAVAGVVVPTAGGAADVTTPGMGLAAETEPTGGIAGTAPLNGGAGGISGTFLRVGTGGGVSGTEFADWEGREAGGVCTEGLMLATGIT